MKNQYSIFGELCLIALRRGGKKGTEFIFTSIDRADLARANEYQGTWTPKWNPTAKTFYVRGNGGIGYLHRWILRVTDPTIQIDHNDHDGLNNKRSNIIPATVASNGYNRRGAQSNSKSQRRNVYWNARENKWMVWVVHDGRRFYGGYFSDLDEADAKAKEIRINIGLGELTSW